MNIEPGTAFVVALRKRPYDAYDVYTNVGIFRRVDGVIVRVHLGPNVEVLLNRDRWDECYNYPIDSGIAYDFLTEKMPRSKKHART